MTIKIPKFTFRLLKLAVFCLLISAIYKQLAINHNFTDLWQNFSINWNSNNYLYLILVALLMPVNLNIEALKWRWLINIIERIGQLRAFLAICAGITLSMFTPNRVGEFGGRVLLLQRASKLQGSAISLVGSLSQLVASFTIGFFGVIGFLYSFNVVDFKICIALLGVSFLLSFLLFFVYLNIGLLHNLLAKSKRLKKYAEHLKPLLSFSNNELIKALGLSILRHFVFSIQYILLFWFLGIGIETDFATMLILVLSIFFVQTVFPSIALIELGIRSSIAIYFLEYINENPLEIIAASLLLWTINLMIPSLIGLGVLLKLNFRKQVLNENPKQ